MLARGHRFSNRQQRVCLACAVAATCCFCGYWLAVLTDRSPGSSAFNGSQVSFGPAPKRPSAAAADAEIHDFNWHYQKMLKDMDGQLFRFDWNRLMPLMRQDANDTDREFRVRAGRAWMRAQSLVVATTVRTAMQGLPDSLKNADRLRALFNRSWVVVVESDSTDGTREFVHDLTKRDPTVRLLGCGKVNSREPCKPEVKYRSGKVHQTGWEMKRDREDQIDRGQVMSALRNQYLEYTYDHLAPLGATLLMLIDADMTWHSWDLDAIAQGLYYFMAKPKLQQLCSHTCYWNRAHVYDPCSLTFFNNKHFGEDRTKPHLTYDNSLRDPKPDLPPVKVTSCFQALAFHRVSDMVAGRVLYGGAPGEWICEHNTMSRKLAEVYFDPQMKLDVDRIFSG